MTARWTRRHWFREIVERVGSPLSVFKGKGGKWSQLRMVGFAFAVAFIVHWPQTPWGPWDWAAMAVIILAPAIDALFAAAPIGEILGAAWSWAAGVAEKRIPSLKKEDLP